MYTLETLSTINSRFLSAHYELIEADVNKVNECVKSIETSRTEIQPQAGDIVQYTDEQGIYYDNAFIEHIKGNNAYIAEHANVYCDLGEKKNALFSVSAGGAFHYISLEKFTYIGKNKRRFWHFGHCGACADGGIDFYATVNTWICDCNKEECSTKTHDKHYIICDLDNKENEYQFISNTHCAWKNETDFQAWLRTVRANVKPGNWDDQLIVWTYKTIEHHVSPDIFESIDALEDTFLMNGSIRKCKRIYDDTNSLIDLYFVWYWDEPEKEFYQCMEEQNEVIKRYVENQKENRIAREELKSGKIKPINIMKILRRD
ncbi:DUF4121 family protein [Mediterraneibacter sp. NSJ-55]|uniref:DUF4121 family protein n=1 Tax=Mediterraneibacter hominis TaxID=2763054 RepID=A0A923LHJ1_9FIRM|nr:DUF4121 family protein [Mediterraneibacter hominis]MBC5688176.1 DUF4121 family protein [Mediterraneibacter hominis]